MMSDPQDYSCTHNHQEKCKPIKAEPEWEAVMFPSLEPQFSMSGTTFQQLFHLPVKLIPNCHGDSVEENVEKSVHAYLSRTGDDVRTPVSQETCFLPSLKVSKNAASQRQHSNADRDYSSRFCLSCLFGNYSWNETFLFKECQCKTQSSTSLADDNETKAGQFLSPRSSCTKYTPELATEILQRYGLGRDDMEDLLAYPEDQITADKLPHILQQIRIAKEKRMNEKSESCSKPQPCTSSVGRENRTGPVEKVSSHIPKPKGPRGNLTPEVVKDAGETIPTGGAIGNETQTCGFAGTYANGSIGPLTRTGETIGIGTCTAGTIGTGAHSEGSTLMDTNGSRCKGLQPRSSKEVKSRSGLVSSHDQETCTESLSSIKSSLAFSTCGPADRGQTQPNLNLQKILNCFPQDIDAKFPKLDASTDLLLKDIKQQTHSTPKDQTPGTVAPGPSVLNSGIPNIYSDQIKTQERFKCWTKKNQQSVEQLHTQQLVGDWYQTLQHLKPLESQMEKGLLPQGFPAFKPASSSSVQPTMVPLSPCQSPQLPRGLISPPVPQSHHSRQSLATGPVFMALPPPAMMEDYAATPPENFPHTCSLCNIQCAKMKDWILHQNTSVHLEHCKLLRKRYSKWDGNISPSLSFPDKHTKQVPPATAQHFQHQHRKFRSDGCFRSSSNVLHHHRRPEYRKDRSSSSSRSVSPLDYHDSEGRRRKGRSRSGGSQSSRYNCRSRSRSPSLWYDQRYRSRSRSRERPPSPRRKKNHSSKRRSRRSSAHRASDKRRKSSKAKRLTKKLLKSPALQSLLEQPKLKAVVKTLVPVLLSELKKMKTLAASPAPSATFFRSESNLQRSESISTNPQDSSFGPPSLTSSTKPLHLTSCNFLARRKSVASLIVSPHTAESSQRPVKRFLPKTVKRMTTSTLVSKAKILVSKAKEVSGKRVLKKTFTTGTKDGTGSAKDMELREEVSKLPRSKKSKCPAKHSGTGDSKQGATHKNMETNTEESSNGPIMVGKPSDTIMINSIRVKSLCTEVKVFPSEAELASDIHLDRFQTAGDVKDEVEEKTLKVLNPTVKSQPDAAMWNRAQSSEEQELLSEDKSEGFKTNSAEGKLDDLDKVDVHMKNEVETSKPRETEAVDVDKGPAEVKGCKLMETKMSQDPTSENDPTPMQQTPSITAPGMVVKASPQENNILDSESSRPQLKTSAEGVEEQDQTLGWVDNVRTQKKNASKVDNVSSMATEMAPSTSSGLSAAVSSLTVGEKMETLLHPEKIPCFNKKTVMSSKLSSLNATALLVTNLPEYHDGCYCEDDVANLLCPFGFIYKGNNIYILPQKRMAFALMYHVGNIQKIVKHFDRNDVFLRGSKVSLNVVSSKISTMPFEFYSYLMKMMRYKVKDDGSNTVLIHNILPSEAKDLRETLKKICLIRNYLPLLNKVFVQFRSARDADLLGVWYSVLNPTDHHVYRLKIPQSFRTSRPSKRPATAFTDLGIEASVIPTAKCGVARSSSPFWITMRTRPFVFPTFSPWFNIPNYHTAWGLVDIKEAGPLGSEFSTVMLTGLPQEHYTHEDIAKLVWCYFPNQTLHTLYYNVIVLPLQRRAFVFFSSWNACCDFVLNYIENPVCVGGCELIVHFVLEDIQPGFSEETMYRSVMKWSNSPVSDLRVLEERLLCVEVSEASAHIVMMVMKEVALVSPFVNFLSLANRIVIEMSDSSGVAEAVEKVPQGGSSQHELWSRVKRIEASKSLTRRLEGQSEMVKLKPNLVRTRPASVKRDEMVWKPKPRAAKTAALSKICVSGSSSTEISNIVPDQTFWCQQKEAGPSEGPQSSVTAERSLCSPEAPEMTRETLKFSTGNGKFPECISESTGGSICDVPIFKRLDVTNQSTSLETECEGKRIKEVKTSKEEDDGEKEEIFHLVEFVDQKDKDGGSGTPGPDGDRVLHQGGPHHDDHGSSGETTRVKATINLMSHEEETLFKDGSVQQASATQSGRCGEEMRSSSPEEPDEQHETVTYVENQETIKTSTCGTREETSDDLKEEKTPQPEDQEDGVPTEKWTGASHSDEEDNDLRDASESDVQVVDSLDQVKDGPSETSPPATDENQSSNGVEQKPPETNDTTAIKYVPLILMDVTDEEDYLSEEEHVREMAPEEELIGGRKNEETEGWAMETLGETTEGSKCRQGLEEPDEEEGSWLQSEFADEEKPDGCLERGRRRMKSKVPADHRAGSVGPMAKRFCSQPPDVHRTPIPSSCRRPLGEEFVERKRGFFCSLCSVFYLNRSKTKDEHCCSRAHYDNLKMYLQKHQLKLSGSTESWV
nr:uncharacterized protein LOC107376899 isoform X2 [Nothobranchius furzeri]